VRLPRLASATSNHHFATSKATIFQQATILKMLTLSKSAHIGTQGLEMAPNV